jgi:hypothetical protein
MKDKSRPETIRQGENSREIDKQAIARWLDFKANNDMDREGIAKAAQVYAQVLFGRSKGESRAAAEFLWEWQNMKLYFEAVEPEPTVQMPARFVFLAPLVEALNSGNPELFEGLAKAMRRGARSERDRLKKHLIEIDALIRPVGRILSWRDIWNTYCPEHKDTPQNFQKLLKECGIQFEKAGEFRRKKLERVKKRKKNTRSERCVA